MNYRAVSSSWVAAVAYDAQSQTMGVKTRDGAEYHYQGVPRFVYQQFTGSGSIGKAMWRTVLGRYSYRRVA